MVALRPVAEIPKLLPVHACRASTNFSPRPIVALANLPRNTSRPGAESGFVRGICSSSVLKGWVLLVLPSERQLYRKTDSNLSMYHMSSHSAHAGSHNHVGDLISKFPGNFPEICDGLTGNGF